jgi:aspartate kinase
LNNLMNDLREFYKVFKDDNVELIAIRHYQENIIDQLKAGKIVMLEERIRLTVKLVMKDIPNIERID